MKLVRISLISLLNLLVATVLIGCGNTKASCMSDCDSRFNKAMKEAKDEQKKCMEEVERTQSVNNPTEELRNFWASCRMEYPLMRAEGNAKQAYESCVQQCQLRY